MARSGTTLTSETCCGTAALPPTIQTGALVDALRGVADDYMTSEEHYPGHVLIPTAKFDQLRAAAEAINAQ